MIITLKNGKKIELEYNFLVMQYLDEYKGGEENGGGINQLKKDMQHKKNMIAIQGIFLYASVRAALDEPLTYQEAIKLVNMNDLPKINEFYNKEFEKQNEFQKKSPHYTNHKKKSKK